tara:strand:+ start:775 stop:1569 length:795 start_codon:yes stop_codon:yes gene_type:complete
MYQEPQKRRNYIIYILFIFLSGSIFLADLFSNKKFSNLISDNTDFLFPVSQEAIGLFDSLELNFIKNKNTLINENVRLKNEVIELRKLKLINDKLVQEIRSNNELIKNVNVENVVYYKSTILIKNTEDEYLISGGRNINLNKNDLILNEEGFVIGYIVKVFDDHSLMNTIINSEFSIPGIDKYGNQYLVTSNRKELLINSIYIEEMNLNIDYISTDLVFDHIGKFPIVQLSNEEVSNANNKISAIVDINYRFSFDSNIYIVKAK